MAIGDNIQFYRTQLGLSQEELGQKLFVSGQTVSLWENGQTVPTIDNLVRLKEIFGVSVDAILSTGEAVHESTPESSEHYLFRYSDAEWTEIYGFLKKRMLPWLILAFSLFFIALLTEFMEPEHRHLVDFAALSIVFVVLCVWVISLKRSGRRVTNSIYEYRVYSDHFLVDIYRNGEKSRSRKIAFSDIDRMYDTGKYLLLQIARKVFILKKPKLEESSAFFACREKAKRKAPTGKWKVGSLFLFIGSLVSILIGIILCSVLSTVNDLLEENMWVFFLLTPISVASVVFGYVLRSKGFRYRKNVIAGIIVTILLCICGSSAFTPADPQNYGDTQFLQAEQHIDMES